MVALKPFLTRLVASEDAGASVSLKWLLVPLLLTVGVQNILLWRLLDFAPEWAYALAGTLLTAGAFVLAFCSVRAGVRIAARTIVICALTALLLALLGGEGRVVYANVDWQIRDAMLRDLRVHPWPFAYATDDGIQFIRNQVGMYLLPALFGKPFGAQAAEIALLVQNTLVLTAIFSGASVLFANGKARLVALGVFVIFSGMDAIGRVLIELHSPTELAGSHLEIYAYSLQYTSHITQMFWVPHHALSGWLGALLYLLWQQGHVRVGGLLAFLPLLLLWSPLTMMGLLPFAAYAGFTTLLRRQLHWSDILLPAVSAAISVPALFYQGAGAEAVGARFIYLGSRYFLAIGLEILPFLAIAILGGRRTRFGGATLLIVGACLLLMPFLQIAKGNDFVMRATIPSLAILSVIIADILYKALGAEPHSGLARLGYATLVVLSVGALTGAAEVARSLAFAPQERIRCNLVAAWRQQEDLIPAREYFMTPITNLPASMQPRTPWHISSGTATDRCWSRPWTVRRELFRDIGGF